MHRDVVKGPPPRVTSGNYCARNTIIAEPTPRYDGSAPSILLKTKAMPRNPVLAEPTPRILKWNRGKMPETSARLIDLDRKDEVIPMKLVGNKVVPSPPEAKVEGGEMRWNSQYQTTSMGRDIHASGKSLTGGILLERIRPPPQQTYPSTYFQPRTSIARYAKYDLDKAVQATMKRKPRTETKAGIPPGSVSFCCRSMFS